MISASSTNRARWSVALGVMGLDHLERDVALQLAVAGHPDLPDPALRMRSDELETPTRCELRACSRARGFDGHVRLAAQRDRRAEPVLWLQSVVRRASS